MHNTILLDSGKHLTRFSIEFYRKPIKKYLELQCWVSRTVNTLVGWVVDWFRVFNAT